MKSGKLLFLLLCTFIVTFTISPVFAGQKLVRLFSYDPHPSTAKFAQEVPFSGQVAQIEVKFVEQWKTAKNEAYLTGMGFEFFAKKGTRILGATEISQTSITSTGTKPGDVFATGQLGNINISITVDSVVVSKKGLKGVTDMTLNFAISYDESQLESAKKQEALSGPKDTALALAEKMMKRGDSLPASQTKAKMALYKRALNLAPTASTSVAAAAFHQELGKRLQGKVISTIKKTQSTMTTPKIKKVYKSPPTPKLSSPAIKPSAKELYKKARAAFAQGEEPQGRDFLRKAISIAPNYFDAWKLLGENALDNRKYSRAAKAFDSALEIRPNSADAAFKYFKANYYIGEGQLGIDKLEAMKTKYATSNSIKLSLAEAYFQMGELPKAKALCQQVLGVNPDNSKAQSLIQRINRLSK